MLSFTSTSSYIPLISYCLTYSLISIPLISEIQSSSVQLGPIVGGVLGVLTFLVLLPSIMAAMVLTMRHINREGNKTMQGIIIMHE